MALQKTQLYWSTKISPKIDQAKFLYKYIAKKAALWRPEAPTQGCQWRSEAEPKLKCPEDLKFRPERCLELCSWVEWESEHNSGQRSEQNFSVEHSEAKELPSGGPRNIPISQKLGNTAPNVAEFCLSLNFGRSARSKFQKHFYSSLARNDSQELWEFDGRGMN